MSDHRTGYRVNGRLILALAIAALVAWIFVGQLPAGPVVIQELPRADKESHR